MGTLGAATMATLLTAVLVTVHAPPPAAATDHVVGGSVWSIPLRDGMYLAWSFNTTFYIGDNLVFRFPIGFYDVVQVGRGDYEDCTTTEPYNNWRVPPAVVPLDYKGMRYYICGVGNYCKLGLKFHVTIQPR